MSGDEAALLKALPSLSFAFVLLLSRCSAAVMLLPGLGESEPPAILRAGFALGLTLLLMPAVAPLVPAAPSDALHDLLMIGGELLVGGLLGWLARLLALAMPIAGNIMSYMIGLSNVLQPDPMLGQTTILGRMFNLAIPVVVLGSGIYALPLSALAGSYSLIPPGALLPTADTVQTGVAAVATCFSLSLQLAAPLVFAGLLWQVALGLCARLVPQLQIFFVAAPGQILGGLLLLALLSLGMLKAWGDAMSQGFALLPGH